MQPRPVFMFALVATLSACIDGDDTPPTLDAAPTELTVDTRALFSSGRELFTTARPHTNGRSCATCHVLAEDGALSVANVEARFTQNPHDPLFQPLDADDPSAINPTYEHLRLGLVRVVLPLPANMDLIDVDGSVVTPPERTISVWRSVPSIENTAATGPYQLDGRAANLSVQAQGAITNHSQGPLQSARILDQIAAFERDQFSSSRARWVADLIELGVPRNDVPIPERSMVLTATEKRGRDVYDLACAACHGGPTTDQIVNRQVHDSLFFALRPNGNVVFDTAPGQAPKPHLVPHVGEFMNIGIGLLSGYGQRGQLPSFNATVDLPHYRFRFYTDATRSQQVTDLPPIPVTASGDPNDLTPAVDANGAPIFGPSLGVQWFSTDPGRAAITGDPLDFEAFDVPQLRGIAHTAPYFHDNNSETLEQVLDQYSRFILPFIGPLDLPPVYPPEQASFPVPESLSVEQKQDLLAYLQRL
jgi:cytochrome c peroxidase